MSIVVFVVSAQEFNEEKWSTSVTDPDQIDLAIENGYKVSSEQFSLASLASQQEYVLTEHVDFTDANQREVFKEIATTQGFNTKQYRSQLIKYFYSISDFHDSVNKDILEQALSDDISIINQNSRIFYKLIESNDFELEGVFAGYDQVSHQFISYGDNSMRFSAESIQKLEKEGFSKFILTEEGALQFMSPLLSTKEPVKMSNGNIIVLNDNLRVTSGTITLPYKKEIHLPDKCEDCYVSFTKNELLISGENVLIGHNILVRGSVTLNAKYTLFSKKSIFIARSEKSPQKISVEVSEDTLFSNQKPGCYNSPTDQSCIFLSSSEKYMEIHATHNNQIAITDLTPSQSGYETGIDSLAVSIVTDGSKVTYTSKTKDEVIITSSPLQVKGNQQNLPLIAAGFYDEKHKEYCYNFLGSITQYCTKQGKNNGIGNAISDEAAGIYMEHLDALEKYQIGTHYGTKSILSWLMQPPPQSGEPSYFKWIIDSTPADQKGGYGFTIAQATAYVAMTKQRYEISESLKLKDIENEIRSIGGDLSTPEQAIAYVDQRKNGLTSEEALSFVATADLEEYADVPSLQKTSCIDFCEEVMENAFSRAGQSKQYLPVQKEFIRIGGGVQMAQQLERQGWDIVFFAPDSKNPTYNDNENRKALLAYKSGRVWGLPIDASVTDFNPSTTQVRVSESVFDPSDSSSTTTVLTSKREIPPEDRTPLNRNGITQLEGNPSVEGGFVVAKNGYHTGMLYRDEKTGKLNVIEQHWDRYGTQSVFEVTPLEKWDWGSYVVLFPPGTITKKTGAKK